MPTLLNEIPHQYGRVGEPYSFTIPSNTFAESGLSITAKMAMVEDYAISLDLFWLDYEPITQTFSGTPQGFDDEGAWQIEVTAEDDQGNKQKAFFIIMVYAASTTSTLVFPRTAAECDHVIDLSNNEIEKLSTVVGPATVGLVGDVGRLEFYEINKNLFNEEKILITNVDGQATIWEEREVNANNSKAWTIHKSNHLEICGQAVGNDPKGIKAYTGDDGVKVKPDLTANTYDETENPTGFDFANNIGGTVIEIENNCFKGIRLRHIHIARSASAGMKIRTKLDIIDFTTSGTNNILGSNTLTVSSINPLVSNSGFLQLGNDTYEYSSWSGNVFTLVGTLSNIYTEGTEACTSVGIRGHHDMSEMGIEFCLVENVDTEGIYAGEGFYDGRPHRRMNLTNQTLTGSTTLTVDALDGLTAPSGYITIGATGDQYAYSDLTGTTFTLVTPLQEDLDAGQLLVINALPHDIRHSRFRFNVIINAGWDTIQIKNTVLDCEVAYNYMYNSSFRHRGAQNYLLFVSDGMCGKIHHNFGFRSPATGMRLYFSGQCDVYNNVMDEMGYAEFSTEETNGVPDTNTNRQALYGAKNGNVVDFLSMNSGGYELNSVQSITDQGTDPGVLVVNFVHNLLHNYGGQAIELYTDQDFRYGNNLFCEGGTVVEGSTDQFTDLGGNIFTDDANASFIDSANKDFRISAQSIAAASGVDVTSLVTNDYNYNTVTTTDYSGSFKPDTSFSLDNYNYGFGYVEPDNPYTSFQWYYSNSNTDPWIKIPDAELISYTPYVHGKSYRLGVTVRTQNGVEEDESFSNSITL